MRHAVDTLPRVTLQLVIRTILCLLKLFDCTQIETSDIVTSRTWWRDFQRITCRVACNGTYYGVACNGLHVVWLAMVYTWCGLQGLTRGVACKGLHVVWLAGAQSLGHN